MSMEDIEQSIIVIKWVYPIIATGFIVIVSLLIYIWQTNVNRTEKILEQTNKTLAEISSLTAVHNAEIENLKDKVFKK